MLSAGSVQRYEKEHPAAVAQWCSVKKVFLEILQNSQEKTCASVSFFNEVAGLRPPTLLKKRHWHKCLSVNFAKFPRTPFSTEHLRWLLLNTFKGFSQKCSIQKQISAEKFCRTLLDGCSCSMNIFLGSFRCLNILFRRICDLFILLNFTVSFKLVCLK